jgi:hypothetical protein
MSDARWTSNLDEMAKRIEIGALRGLTASAIIVHKTAVVNCVVDTGRLKSSICYTVNGGQSTGGSGNVRPTATNKRPSIGVADQRISSKQNSAFVGTNVEYAWNIEVNGGKEGRGKGFIRNALTTRIKACQNVIRSEIERAIKNG